jgi:hypothetical protein
VHLYSRLQEIRPLETSAETSGALVFEQIPDTVFPRLFSDDEFEDIRHKYSGVARAQNDRWDNRTPLDAAPPYDGKPEATIEQKFPHIAKHLVAMWGSEACALYLQRLIIADREGKQGFPPHVLQDLVMLDAVNDMVMDQKRMELAAKMETL